jgi:hypothetical protein
MALTQLADAIIPEVYASYQSVDNIELTAFYESGIIVQSAELNDFAQAGGITLNMPFWKDLDQTQEPNYSDDTENEAAPDKLASGKMAARTAQINNGWKASDIVSERAGSDPMKRIAARTNAYWSRQWQRRLISTCKGVLAENIATGSAGVAGDMVLDVSITDGVNATDANLFSRDSFADVVFTLGDQFGLISGIAVHSIVYKRMVKNDDIAFVEDSEGKLSIPTYMGKRVVVDDSMPVVAGGVSGFVYTSVLFGAGAFGYGIGKPRIPVEVERKAAQGNGGGAETLWERKTWLIHPLGYKWNETAVAGDSPSLAELATASNWTRVIARKNIPLAFLKTNG